MWLSAGRLTGCTDLPARREPLGLRAGALECELDGLDLRYVRLGEKENLARFYPQLGDVLKKRFAGWTAFIFSGDPEIARLIRLQASRRTVLYNGALECRLYEYRMVAGGNRRMPGRGAPGRAPVSKPPRR